MPPKKKGGKEKGGGKKKADAEATEPPLNPAWDVAVETGIWSAPVEELPDPALWPTWGALRERVLGATKELTVSGSPAATDEFAAELVKLSPMNLTKLALQNCPRLSRFALSPTTSCPALKQIDLSDCSSLETVLVQSNSAEKLTLTGCPKLTKLLVQAKGLKRLDLRGCPNLTTIAVWSDELTGLDLTDCQSLLSVDLYCPELLEEFITVAPRVPEKLDPSQKYPPLVNLLRLQCRNKARVDERNSERSISILEYHAPRIFHAIS